MIDKAIEPTAVGRIIGFWMRKVRDLRIKLALANSDYADLKADFEDLNERYLGVVIDCSYLEQRVVELEAIAGRVEDRRYQP